MLINSPGVLYKKYKEKKTFFKAMDFHPRLIYEGAWDITQGFKKKRDILDHQISNNLFLILEGSFSSVFVAQPG